MSGATTHTLLREKGKQREFKLTLEKKYRALEGQMEGEDLGIEVRWAALKEMFSEACKEVLGPRRSNHKDWISPESIQLLQARKGKKAAVNSSHTRAEKARAQEEYGHAHKATCKSIRADKQTYFDNLESEAEEAASRNDMKTLYSITQTLSGKFGKSERPVKDKHGKAIAGKEEQKNRWREHFEEILNRPSPANPPDILPAEADLPVECGTPTKQEIKKAIRQMKSGKAPGPDNIPAEALKVDVEETTELLHPLFVKMWEEEIILAEWKEGYLVKLPKKGDMSNCANYRLITLSQGRYSTVAS